MDIKREPVIDAQGRHRGYKLWIVCPVCELGRWVREDATRPETFTGMCSKCHAKFTTGQREAHSRWKGGTIRGDGYKDIRIYPDNPYFAMARKSSGNVREHRLVMAKHLGRCLAPWEMVHHKGTKYPQGSWEDKHDNRLENLELITERKYHRADAASIAIMNRFKKQHNNNFP